MEYPENFQAGERSKFDLEGSVAGGTKARSGLESQDNSPPAVNPTARPG